MPELLLELFSEEIPARMQARAAADLAKLLSQHLNEAGLAVDGVEAHAGPRRLTAVITDLPARSPDVREERKGPKVGAPEKAIEGFLRGAGLERLDQCEQRDTPKGPVWFALIDKPGRMAPDILAEAIPAIVRHFPWPKSMRWGAGRLHWVRPLHGIVCVLDGAVVPFAVDGVESGARTYGHRFHGSGAITVTGFADYAEKLMAAKVMLDAEARKAAIQTRARALCSDAGFELVADPGLLQEVAGLAEWPVVLMGAMDPAFLDLPDEVIQLSMRTHQKYFAVRDPETGALAAKFIVVANIEAPDGGAAIAQGNARVLSARLNDARFFWDQDRKTPLGEMADGLGRIVFHQKLGTVGDKVDRVAALTRDLAPAVGADPDLAERAARLAKADLVSEMVGEFPELQGVMGRYYALEQGEPTAVADAIRDHYKPQGPSDAVPSDPVAIAVALADKLDTLTGFWAIDEKPTGSKDPYALRRAALGVIRIVLDNAVRLRLSPIVEPDLLHFFYDRLKGHLREEGVRHDVIDAVLAPDTEGRLPDDLVLIVKRARALQDFLGTEDGANLLAGHKRAANILQAEIKKGFDADAAQAEATGGADGVLAAILGAPRALEPEEAALAQAVRAVRAPLEAALEAEDFAQAMVRVAQLRGPVDAFFDQVLVNAPEAEVRRDRLLLLLQIRDALAAVADFDRIEG